MTARTLRALWRARLLVNAEFRSDPATAKLLFLHILQQPRGIVHEFRRMNQYGILGRYLPEFGKIVGQMQHDLFHVYTVDQHILMVVRNLRRFTMPEFAHEFPLCSRAHERLRAALAAVRRRAVPRHRQGPRRRPLDARRRGRAPVLRRRTACRREDGELVEFLVEHHLTMSHVAQKQDISDPDVIRAFAELVGSERRLVALYLLRSPTSAAPAPRCGTPGKASCSRTCSGDAARAHAARRCARDAVQAEKQAEAARLLRLYALSDGVKDKLWAQPRHRLLPAPRRAGDRLADAQPALPRRHRQAGGQGAPRADRRGAAGDDLHARPRGAVRAHLRLLRARRFNIVEAKIHTTRHGYALDTFVVHGPGPRRALPRPASR